MSVQLDLHVYCRELVPSSLLSLEGMFKTGKLETRWACTIIQNMLASDKKEWINHYNRLLVGLEINTEVGDFIVFSPDPWRFQDIPLNMSFDAANQRGFFSIDHAIVWVHPYRGGRNSSFQNARDYGLDKIMDMVDAVEISNGKDLLTAPQMNDRAKELAIAYCKAMVGGSESYQVLTSEMVVTEFARPITSMLQMIDQIKNKEVTVLTNHSILVEVLSSFALKFAV